MNDPTLRHSWDLAQPGGKKMKEQIIEFEVPTRARIKVVIDISHVQQTVPVHIEVDTPQPTVFDFRPAETLTNDGEVGL